MRAMMRLQPAGRCTRRARTWQHTVTHCPRGRAHAASPADKETHAAHPPGSTVLGGVEVPGLALEGCARHQAIHIILLGRGRVPAGASERTGRFRACWWPFTKGLLLAASCTHTILHVENMRCKYKRASSQEAAMQCRLVALHLHSLNIITNPSTKHSTPYRSLYFKPCPLTRPPPGPGPPGSGWW